MWGLSASLPREHPLSPLFVLRLLFAVCSGFPASCPLAFAWGSFYWDIKRLRSWGEGSGNHNHRSFWSLDAWGGTSHKQMRLLGLVEAVQVHCKLRDRDLATSDEHLSVFFFFSFIFISWRLITLQYCSVFCHTLTWISHGFTCIPHPMNSLNLSL